MKRFLFCLCCFYCCGFVFPQKATLNVDAFYLNNGMKVLLCEDHSKPEIFGGICVNVGSKNDPSDATGMAHYFEHIMFKGTDQIGTINPSAEKVYLDSISSLYDRLHETTDNKLREQIQKEINRFSHLAAQYAIPNEIDVILNKMGGEDINASTNYDYTLYYNSFPSNQLNKWLMVYAERFRNPVFRLFQSELETVYEEYNMYADDPFSVMLEDVMKAAFGDHPYGRPVIGYPEHLKNPQMSKMYQFFNKYYRPQNMTLILVGDLNVKECKPLIEKMMGQLSPFPNEIAKQTLQLAEKKDVKFIKRPKPFPLPPVKKIEGNKIIVTKQTPVKVGVIAYQTVPSSNNNNIYLDICAKLLSNDASTGLLDMLTNNNKLYAAQAMNCSLGEAGAFAVIYFPKLLAQSHENAEESVNAAIADLKNGNFSSNLFNAVKMDILREAIENLESCKGKFDAIVQNEMDGKTTEQYLKELDVVKNMSKEDIMRIARLYFGNNKLIYRSGIGTKPVNKIDKPDWQPLVAQNTEARSDFAQRVANRRVPETNPQIIDFKKDVDIIPVNDNFTLYTSPNPYNDLFSLSLVFNYGLLNNADLEQSAHYFSSQGCDNGSFENFQLQLQQKGASLDVEVTDNTTTVLITGFEKDIAQIIQLCARKLYHPNNDESKLKLLIEEESNSRKITKDDPSEWATALWYYAVYKTNSPYLTHPSLKDVKAYSGDYLLKCFSDAIKTDGHITFTGNFSSKQLINIINDNFSLNESKKTNTDRQLYKTSSTAAVNSQVRVPVKYDEPQLLMVHNAKFLQSNIYFYMLGDFIKEEDKAAMLLFNEYYDGGMNSIIFQEIREMRSLGYSAYAFYSQDYFNKRPGFLLGYLGTQSDKTVEGITAMSDLMMTMPSKLEKFAVAKESAIQKNAAYYIDFRSVPEQVYKWEKAGFVADPRPARLQTMRTLEFKDVNAFYNRYLQAKPLVVMVAGDMGRVNKKMLNNFGTVKELKFTDLYK